MTSCQSSCLLPSKLSLSGLRVNVLIACFDRLLVQGQQGQHDDMLRSLKRRLTDLAVADKQPQLLPSLLR